MRNLKNTKAITLVALIITIIVLLILATVSIALVMNGGIIGRADNSVKAYSNEEVTEQLKLAYAEYQMSRFTGNTDEFNNLLKTKLESIYGGGNVDIISSEENIVIKVNENGDSKFYEYNPNTSNTKELQKGINYNGKTPSEIQPGDDITIVTEKFKVFTVENNKIKAMPYYNITLTDNPIQSKNAGTTKFSNSNYWTQAEDTLNMSNSENCIGEIINSYKTTLKTLGANLEVRAARYSELSTSGISSNMRNPSKNGGFWLGSSANDYAIYRVSDTGSINSLRYGNDTQGVRPIIEIAIQ